MEYVYRIIADLVAIVHFAFILYVVFGQLMILVGRFAGWQWVRNPWFRVSHLAFVLIVAIEAFVEFECPLTTWERDLRWAAGASGAISSHGFISDWINYFMACDNEQPVLEWCYYGFATLVLITLVLVPPRFRRPKPIVAPTPEPPTASASTTATANVHIKAES